MNNFQQQNSVVSTKASEYFDHDAVKNLLSYFASALSGGCEESSISQDSRLAILNALQQISSRTRESEDEPVRCEQTSAEQDVVLLESSVLGLGSTLNSMPSVQDATEIGLWVDRDRTYFSTKMSDQAVLERRWSSDRVYYSLRRPYLSSLEPFYGDWTPSVMRVLQDQMGLGLSLLHVIQSLLIDSDVPTREPVRHWHFDENLRGKLSGIVLAKLLGQTLMVSRHDSNPKFAVVSYPVEDHDCVIWPIHRREMELTVHATFLDPSSSGSIRGRAPKIRALPEIKAEQILAEHDAVPEEAAGQTSIIPDSTDFNHDVAQANMGVSAEDDSTAASLSSLLSLYGTGTEVGLSPNPPQESSSSNSYPGWPDDPHANGEVPGAASAPVPPQYPMETPRSLHFDKAGAQQSSEPPELVQPKREPSADFAEGKFAADKELTGSSMEERDNARNLRIGVSWSSPIASADMVDGQRPIEPEGFTQVKQEHQAGLQGTSVCNHSLPRHSDHADAFGAASPTPPSPGQVSMMGSSGRHNPHIVASGEAGIPEPPKLHESRHFEQNADSSCDVTGHITDNIPGKGQASLWNTSSTANNSRKRKAGDDSPPDDQISSNILENIKRERPDDRPQVVQSGSLLDKEFFGVSVKIEDEESFSQTLGVALSHINEDMRTESTDLTKSQSCTPAPTDGSGLSGGPAPSLKTLQKQRNGNCIQHVVKQEEEISDLTRDDCDTQPPDRLNDATSRLDSPREAATVKDEILHGDGSVPGIGDEEQLPVFLPDVKRRGDENLNIEVTIRTQTTAISAGDSSKKSETPDKSGAASKSFLDSKPGAEKARPASLQKKTPKKINVKRKQDCMPKINPQKKPKSPNRTGQSTKNQNRSCSAFGTESDTDEEVMDLTQDSTSMATYSGDSVIVAGNPATTPSPELSPDSNDEDDAVLSAILADPMVDLSAAAELPNPGASALEEDGDLPTKVLDLVDLLFHEVEFNALGLKVRFERQSTLVSETGGGVTLGVIYGDNLTPATTRMGSGSKLLTQFAYALTSICRISEDVRLGVRLWGFHAAKRILGLPEKSKNDASYNGRILTTISDNYKESCAARFISNSANNTYLHKFSQNCMRLPFLCLSLCPDSGIAEADFVEFFSSSYDLPKGFAVEWGRFGLLTPNRSIAQLISLTFEGFADQIQGAKLEFKFEPSTGDEKFWVKALVGDRLISRPRRDSSILAGKSRSMKLLTRFVMTMREFAMMSKPLHSAVERWSRYATSKLLGLKLNSSANVQTEVIIETLRKLAIEGKIKNVVRKLLSTKTEELTRKLCVNFLRVPYLCMALSPDAHLTPTDIGMILLSEWGVKRPCNEMIRTTDFDSISAVVNPLLSPIVVGTKYHSSEVEEADLTGTLVAGKSASKPTCSRGLCSGETSVGSQPKPILDDPMIAVSAAVEGRNPEAPQQEPDADLPRNVVDLVDLLFREVTFDVIGLKVRFERRSITESGPNAGVTVAVVYGENLTPPTARQGRGAKFLTQFADAVTSLYLISDDIRLGLGLWSWHAAKRILGLPEETKNDANLADYILKTICYNHADSAAAGFVSNPANKHYLTKLSQNYGPLPFLCLSLCPDSAIADADFMELFSASHDVHVSKELVGSAEMERSTLNTAKPTIKGLISSSFDGFTDSIENAKLEFRFESPVRAGTKKFWVRAMIGDRFTSRPRRDNKALAEKSHPFKFKLLTGFIMTMHEFALMSKPLYLAVQRWSDYAAAKILGLNLTNPSATVRNEVIIETLRKMAVEGKVKALVRQLLSTDTGELKRKLSANFLRVPYLCMAVSADAGLSPNDIDMIFLQNWMVKAPTSEMMPTTDLDPISAVANPPKFPIDVGTTIYPPEGKEADIFGVLTPAKKAPTPACSEDLLSEETSAGMQLKPILADPLVAASDESRNSDAIDLEAVKDLPRNVVDLVDLLFREVTFDALGLKVRFERKSIADSGPDAGVTVAVVYGENLTPATARQGRGAKFLTQFADTLTCICHISEDVRLGVRLWGFHAAKRILGLPEESKNDANLSDHVLKTIRYNHAGSAAARFVTNCANSHCMKKISQNYGRLPFLCLSLCPDSGIAEADFVELFSPTHDVHTSKELLGSAELENFGLNTANPTIKELISSAFDGFTGSIESAKLEFKFESSASVRNKKFWVRAMIGDRLISRPRRDNKVLAGKSSSLKLLTRFIMTMREFALMSKSLYSAVQMWSQYAVAKLLGLNVKNAFAIVKTEVIIETLRKLAIEGKVKALVRKLLSTKTEELSQKLSANFLRAPYLCMAVCADARLTRSDISMIFLHNWSVKAPTDEMVSTTNFDPISTAVNNPAPAILVGTKRHRPEKTQDVDLTGSRAPESKAVKHTCSGGLSSEETSCGNKELQPKQKFTVQQVGQLLKIYKDKIRGLDFSLGIGCQKGGNHDDEPLSVVLKIGSHEMESAGLQPGLLQKLMHALRPFCLTYAPLRGAIQRWGVQAATWLLGTDADLSRILDAVRSVELKHGKQSPGTATSALFSILNAHDNSALMRLFCRNCLRLPYLAIFITFSDTGASDADLKAMFSSETDLPICPCEGLPENCQIPAVGASSSAPVSGSSGLGFKKVPITIKLLNGYFQTSEKVNGQPVKILLMKNDKVAKDLSLNARIGTFPVRVTVKGDTLLLRYFNALRAVCIQCSLLRPLIRNSGLIVAAKLLRVPRSHASDMSVIEAVLRLSKDSAGNRRSLLESSSSAGVFPLSKMDAKSLQMRVARNFLRLSFFAFALADQDGRASALDIESVLDEKWDLPESPFEDDVDTVAQSKSGEKNSGISKPGSLADRDGEESPTHAPATTDGIISTPRSAIDQPVLSAELLQHLMTLQPQVIQSDDEAGGHQLKLEIVCDDHNPNKDQLRVIARISAVATLGMAEGKLFIGTGVSPNLLVRFANALSDLYKKVNAPARTAVRKWALEFGATLLPGCFSGSTEDMILENIRTIQARGQQVATMTFDPQVVMWVLEIYDDVTLLTKFAKNCFRLPFLVLSLVCSGVNLARFDIDAFFSSNADLPLYM